MQVYFIVAEEHSRIKIGTTTQPKKRFACLANENLPCNIYMILIPNSPITEMELLHKYSKDLYCRREWFYGSQQLYIEIQHLYDNYDGIVISLLTYMYTSSGDAARKEENKRKARADHFANPNYISGHDIKHVDKPFKIK